MDTAPGTPRDEGYDEPKRDAERSIVVLAGIPGAIVELAPEEVVALVDALAETRSDDEAARSALEKMLVARRRLQAREEGRP